MSTKAFRQETKVLISAEQIQRRIPEIAKQIASDYEGKTVYVVCVLENGFVFTSDLIRALDIPLICQFLRPVTTEKTDGSTATTEIFYEPEIDVRDQDVLLVEALVQSGQTTEFLMRNLMSRGAKSVKLCALLDRQAARTVSLQPDYFGFLVDASFVVGYGLGAPQLGRNLPFIGTLKS